VVGEWLRDSGAAHVVVDRDAAWVDPDRTSELLVACEPVAFARALATRCRRAPGGRRAWAGSWAEAEAAAQAAIGVALGGTSLRDPAVARTVAAAVPEGATLVASSSMPVRDLEWYAAPRAGLRVLSNRGANGIDGVLSTAVGAAVAARSAARPAPTAVLIGDIAFLHDANGLLGLAARGLDLTIVVVDNRGGAIFSFLPQQTALAPSRFEQLFGTPHDVAIAALAAAHGVPTVHVHDLEAPRSGRVPPRRRRRHDECSSRPDRPPTSRPRRGPRRRPRRLTGHRPDLFGSVGDQWLPATDVHRRNGGGAALAGSVSDPWPRRDGSPTDCIRVRGGRWLRGGR
jgi:2-succinyl-5-enolpyruvyl-6-hydroxy-3-cyclohexene-1-carboxylate synthase